MKSGSSAVELDTISVRLLQLLQEDCKTPLATLGGHVGLSAASVVERIRKLEDAGIIEAYAAKLDARKLGKDITAFVGVSTAHASQTEAIESRIAEDGDVLEVHHVTGAYTFMVKVKTENTATLEAVLHRLVAIDGVTHTETMVALSTHTERWKVPICPDRASAPRRSSRLACGAGKGSKS